MSEDDVRRALCQSVVPRLCSVLEDTTGTVPNDVEGVGIFPKFYGFVPKLQLPLALCTER